ncbi:MAG: DUF4405 domain-containing protein [Candidatus Xenobiia bacterium LiM19]
MKAEKIFYADVAMLFSFLIVTATGFLRWIFKPGAVEGIWVDVLQAGCRLFGILHRWSGLLFVILAFYHIYYHWNWILEMSEKLKKEYSERNSSQREADSQENQ